MQIYLLRLQGSWDPPKPHLLDPPTSPRALSAGPGAGTVPPLLDGQKADQKGGEELGCKQLTAHCQSQGTAFSQSPAKGGQGAGGG